MDDTQDISELARELSDLELALLLCLGGQEHCLIEATGGNINDVAAELALVSSTRYFHTKTNDGFRSARIHMVLCTKLWNSQITHLLKSFVIKYVPTLARNQGPQWNTALLMLLLQKISTVRLRIYSLRL